MEENDYIIDVETAISLLGLNRPDAKKLVKKNKAKLNKLIVDKLANQNSYQAMSLLYGIVNLDSAEKVYGCKTDKAEITDNNHTIKIEVSSKNDEEKLQSI